MGLALGQDGAIIGFRSGQTNMSRTDEPPIIIVLPGL